LAGAEIPGAPGPPLPHRRVGLDTRTTPRLCGLIDLPREPSRHSNHVVPVRGAFRPRLTDKDRRKRPTSDQWQAEDPVRYCVYLDWMCRRWRKVGTPQVSLGIGERINQGLASTNPAIGNRAVLLILGRLGVSRVNPSGGDLRALLEACRAGNEVAWEQFLAWVRMRSRASLSGFRPLNADDRDDVVAEVTRRLVDVIRQDQVRGTTDSEIDAYIRTALRNQALNLVRGRAARGDQDPSPEDLPDHAPTPPERTVTSQVLKRAQEAMMRWPPEDRYLFVAKLEGVSSSQIQATLERPPYRVFISVTTVDTRYHKLKKVLREEADQ